MVKSANTRKLDFSHFISTALEVHGDTYTYDEGAYLGWRVSTAVTCKTHGVFKVTPEAHVKLERGCRRCRLAERVGKFRKTVVEFESAAAAVHNGKYVYTGDYTGALEPITVICSVHGNFTQQAYVHLRGAGCQSCAKESAAEKSRTTFEDFVAAARASHGDTYDYIREGYVSASSPVSIVCRTHGLFTQVGSTHINRTLPSRCPKCAIKQSRGQLELAEFVRSLGFEVQEDFRYGSGKKSVDVFVPAAKLCIEFDGTYFHSSKFRADNDMIVKRKAVESEGLQLINIFSDEWANRKVQVKSLIANRLGVKQQKVYARACTVAKLSAAEASEFHNNNHVQGFKSSGTSYGLTHSGKLVAVMTFTQKLSNRQASVAGVWELSRYSTSCTVVGGASKLLAAFRRSTPVDKIRSYSDNRLFTGAMYKSLGFSLKHVTSPNYKYVGEGCGDRIGKSHFTRTRLAARFGAAFDATLTERENCKNLGFWQVYDCGLNVWELN